ncbi:uncharacterized protein NFIA_010260 [Aspergillus fischeri NRRL 181]|uniref:Uncharacterized protein n=1 Tax=Neosartorya fischeri (strain ATCC 1020 / DSM 3700 / CBS 544.65 / FGSC A1164 / JCM 1740 / NRRL 181 / WB 181) TaxID=331117 RepID=A1D1Q2_NEOFI|nr:uncharacterized protein NFIA_010260 [Aspergillus fischeri NRRL 181]EAW22345.1 hypothetical protein NFIA_010260 [Aspergillus fischeri NRRL 181]
MPHYLVRTPESNNEGNTPTEVLNEIESHGGSFVREERFLKAYVLTGYSGRYDIPEEDLDLNKFRTKNYMFSLERQD